MKDLYDQKVKLEYDKYISLKDKNSTNTKEIDSQIEIVENQIAQRIETFESEKQIIKDLIDSYNSLSNFKSKVKEYEKDNNISASYNLKNSIIPQIEKKIKDLSDSINNFKEYKAIVTEDIFKKSSQLI
ncbi:hypothetical protein [Mycoplasma sp. OR1901]|uniref:hypothetical protein n=1 Tax=Mycoplasma sp. OR1901 TaxID=2742195 RepID=UPI00158238C0|nr:hypothetical protein [Mycoplasma sp. OR1901]QKT05664.1 hypothetical protein HTZ87_03070 [Mycoplasma sp. OR1901]